MAYESAPIVDLAAINELQSRVAALETALGQYNAASAVVAASQGSAGTGASTGTVNVITDTIKVGETPGFSVSSTLANTNFKTITTRISFGHTYASPPQVYVTPKSIHTGKTLISGYPNAIAITVGAVTTTDFQVRITNLLNENVTASVCWMARGQ